MEIFILGIIWFVVAIVVGVAAHQRGRNGVLWFLLAVLLSPLIAGLLLILFPMRGPAPVDRARVGDELERNIRRSRQFDDKA